MWDLQRIVVTATLVTDRGYPSCEPIFLNPRR